MLKRSLAADQVQRFDELFSIVSMPEFLAEGQAIDNLIKPERIVIGTSDSPKGHEVFEQLKALFLGSIEKHGSKVIHTCQASSELGKLMSNAMLA